MLGLLSEPEGLAGQAIVALGRPLDEVRTATLNLLQARGGIRKGRIRFDRNTKKTLELALREALHLGHNYIGTEHLLLGLLRNDQELAAELLTGMGVTLDRTHEWIVAELARLAAAKDAG